MSTRYFDRQGREIRSSSATAAGWALVKRDGLMPMKPYPGPNDRPPRVKLTERSDKTDMVAEWEWVLTRCACGHAVLWPINSGTTDACWYHRPEWLITVGLEDLAGALEETARLAGET